jgi:hypothetical protein
MFVPGTPAVSAARQVIDQYKSGPLGRSLRTDTCEVPLLHVKTLRCPFDPHPGPLLHGSPLTRYHSGEGGTPPTPPLFLARMGGP